MVENFEKILAGSLHLEDHGISDMSASYLSAVREVFPNAKQTIDKFRVKQVLLKALDAVRIDAFVEMRHFIAGNAHLFERIERVELKHLTYQKETDEKFEQVFDFIHAHTESSQKMFFNGQIYDAFSLLAGLIQKAAKDIILIDGYVDIGTLDLLAKNKSMSVWKSTPSAIRD